MKTTFASDVPVKHKTKTQETRQIFNHK